MVKYTTVQIAEYLGTTTHCIRVHIHKGNLKAKKENGFYIIEHKEYLNFVDYFLYEKGKKCGFAHKKIPDIDEYDLELKNYNNYVAEKIKRDKEILKAIVLDGVRYKGVAKKFNLSVHSIQKIVIKNKETDFYKKLHYIIF